MKLRHLLLAFTFAFLFFLPIAAQENNRAILRRKLINEIEKIATSFDGVMGVAIRDLTTGEEILINQHLTFPTGSSIKIPVMIQVFRDIRAGKLRMDQDIPVSMSESVVRVSVSMLLHNLRER